MIYDYFRDTGAEFTVLDCADQFPITLRDDDAQDFDTTWDEIFINDEFLQMMSWRIYTN